MNQNRNLTVIIKSLITFTNIGITLLFAKTSEDKRKIGVKFRKYFEDLGGIYIKFGQILSLRRDLLPEEICSELRLLLDNVPIFDNQVAINIIEKEFKRPCNEIFSEISDQPLASASLGQVYKAKLINGDKVVIKILRPNISEKVSKDLKLLLFIGRIIDLIPFINIRFYPLVKEFNQWIIEELDYRNEAKNLLEFSEFTTPILPIFNIPVKSRVPKIYPDYCTSNILVMEFIEGYTINQLISFRQNPDQTDYIRTVKEGYDYMEIGKQISLMTMKQIFIDGYFNADPHPANIIATKNNDIYFLDFGLVGKLNKRAKVANFKFARSLVLLDKEGAFKSIKTLLDVKRVKDEENLKRTLYRLIDELRLIREGGSDDYTKSSADAIFSVLGIINKYNIQIPRNVAKGLRTVLTADGIVNNLNPEMTFKEATQDILRVSLAATYLEMKENLNQTTGVKMLFRFINYFEDEIVFT